MKIKSIVNLLVDLILFILIIPTMLTRHQIHEIVGYSFGLFILVHFLLHGKQIFAMVKTWLPNIKVRQAFISVFCLLCIGLSIWSMTTSGGEREKHGFPLRDHQSIQSSEASEIPANPTK